MMTDARLVTRVVDRIKPHLGGLPAEVQGAVIADLLAIWLAGHVFRGDPEKTRAYRAELLQAHIETVRGLTEVNAGILGTRA